MTQAQAPRLTAPAGGTGEAPDRSAEHFRPPSSLREIVSARFAALRHGDLGSSAVIIATVLIWIVFQSLNSQFLADTNLHNLARQISYGGLISLGVVMILLLGEVDLSVGSISGVGAAVLAVLVERHGWNPYLGILATIACGAVLGTVQGLVRVRFNVPSFIVTLGGLLLFLGLQLRLLGTTGSIRFPFGGAISHLEGSSVTPAAGYLLAALAIIGLAALTVTGRRRRARAGLAHDPIGLVVVKIVAAAVVLLAVVWELNRAIGVPVALIIFLLLALGFWALITQTRYGQHVLAVGGNAEAARRAGIKVGRIRVSVFAISGAMAAAGGIMSASYVGAASQDLGGDTILLYSIAAAVIGGTSLFGGRGSAWSAVTGWLVIGSIYNGMFLLNLVSDLQYMVIGAVLVAAVVVDSVSRRHRAA